MTCARCNLACCICELVTDHAGIGGTILAVLCVAVYLGAFAYALLPAGAP